MSTKTRAVIAPRPGGPEALQIVERPRPVPGEGEMLVRVRAAGMNRMDVLQRQGDYPLPPDASDVLGVELAGVVESRVIVTAGSPEKCAACLKLGAGRELKGQTSRFA